MSDRRPLILIVSILLLFSTIIQEFNCCYAFSFSTVIIGGGKTRSRSTVHQDGTTLLMSTSSSSSSSSFQLFMTSTASASASVSKSEEDTTTIIAVIEEEKGKEDNEVEIERKRRLKEKFETLRKGFPKNANIVNAGGWYNLEQLSYDPKSTLVEFIIDGIKKEKQENGKKSNSVVKTTMLNNNIEQHREQEKEGVGKVVHDNEKLEALCLLLYGMGKGFIADTMNGEWDIVFTKSTATSTSTTTTSSSSRNTVVIGDKSNKDNNNINNKLFFNIKKLIFKKCYTFWKWGLLTNTIKYAPISENYSISSNGKIVVRRIVCTLLNRILKWWKLPSIRLPTIRAIKKRYLDIIYLDDDICISGSGFNGGGGGTDISGQQNLFIHFRPKYLQSMMSQYNRFTTTATTTSGSGIGHSNSNRNNYGDILDDGLC